MEIVSLLKNVDEQVFFFNLGSAMNISGSDFLHYKVFLKVQILLNTHRDIFQYLENANSLSTLLLLFPNEIFYALKQYREINYDIINPFPPYKST